MKRRVEYERNRGYLCIYCLDYHIGECETKTCFKCGKLGHLVSQCIFKYDKLTCFKCGKKGHKIYDCQIFITTSNTYCRYSVEREPQTVENQKRGWMKEEIKRAKCVQCGSIGHLYCTNDHLLTCKMDGVYKSGGKGYNIGRDFFNCSTYNHYEQFKNGGVDNNTYANNEHNNNRNFGGFVHGVRMPGPGHFLSFRGGVPNSGGSKKTVGRRVSQFERSLEKFKSFDRLKMQERREKKKIRVEEEDAAKKNKKKLQKR